MKLQRSHLYFKTLSEVMEITVAFRNELGIKGYSEKVTAMAAEGTFHSLIISIAKTNNAITSYDAVKLALRLEEKLGIACRLTKNTGHQIIIKSAIA